MTHRSRPTRPLLSFVILAWGLTLGTLSTGSDVARDPQGPAAPNERLLALIPECEACHGPGGVSSEEDVPSLAGQSSAYLRELLEQFYHYERHCPTTTYRHGDRPRTPLNMCDVASTLNEQDKDGLARYFADKDLP